MSTRKKTINWGYMEIPVDYFEMDEETREIVCDVLIDKLLIALQRRLPDNVNLINYLDEVLSSTIEINEEEENYELCSVVRDVRKRLHDKRN